MLLHSIPAELGNEHCHGDNFAFAVKGNDYCGLKCKYHRKEYQGYKPTASSHHGCRGDEIHQGLLYCECPMKKSTEKLSYYYGTSRCSDCKKHYYAS